MVVVLIFKFKSMFQSNEDRYSAPFREQLLSRSAYSMIFLIRYMYIWYKCITRGEQSNIRTWDAGPGTLGPKNRDPGSQDRDPGTWDPGTLELGPWDLELATLGHGILTPGTLEMVPWDPETSKWPLSQIVLTLFMKQILII